MVRLLMTIALLAFTPPCARAEPPPRPIARYDMQVEILPEQRALAIQGTMELPRSAGRGGTVQLTVSDAVGEIEWRAGAASARLLTSSKRPASDGNAVWHVASLQSLNKSLTLHFRYRLRTSAASKFLYVGPEVSFGAGGFYPEMDGVRSVGTMRITAPAGELAAVGRQAAERRQAGRITRTFYTEVPSELFFAYAPAGASTARIGGRLSLTTLRRRDGDAAWRVGLTATAAALEAEFGAMPYPHVTVFEVPDAIADQAGFGAFAASGAVLAKSSFFDQPINVAAFAHEFAHLWWGNFVGLRGKRGDFLLDEGLAQYGAMIAVDRVLGNVAGTRFRRDGAPGFNESLYSALGYLKIVATGQDRPLLTLGDDGLSYWIAYSKAGLAWYALAAEMGTDRFGASLRKAVARHGGSDIGWDQFVAILEQESPRVATPFIADWFVKPGAPDYAVLWRLENGRLVGQITQHGDIKRATVELAVRCGTAALRHAVKIADHTTAFQFPARCPVTEVVLDPDYKVLRWTEALRREAAAAAPYMQASILSRLGRNDEAEKVLVTALKLQPANDNYDTALLARAMLVRLMLERGCAECAVSNLRETLALTPQHPARLAMTYYSLATRAKRLDRIDLARVAAARARQADELVANANGVVLKLELAGL